MLKIRTELFMKLELLTQLVAIETIHLAMPGII